MNKSLISICITLGLTMGYANASATSNWKETDKVFNSYEKSEQLLPVSIYMSNWGVYERQFDATEIVNKYDKIIYSFVGLCGSEVGDPTSTSAIRGLAVSCSAANKKDFEIAFTDLNSDINNNFGAGSNWNATFHTGQDKAGGLIAVLRDAKLANPELELAFSVGGWSLSEPFSRMAESKQHRTTFINSAIEWFTLYPMFDQIDIDWEYPGGGGAQFNSWSDKDGENYVLLVKELRDALNSQGLAEKKIAIAAGAPKTKLAASNLKQLVESGVDYIHLMSYDFMGEWQDKLAHHTNLSGTLSYMSGGEETFNSAALSIDYMIDVLGVPADTIQLGYANYSRNAGTVNLDSVSPLIGSFTPGTSTNDSFETGVSELFDYQDKVVDFTSAGAFGLNGYQLYTDTDANADFLYNDQTKQFISIDTPRSVYAKAQYAKQRGLAGVFGWMADHDPGYHVNAARQGLGYQVTSETLDMDNLVNHCGFIDTNNASLTDAECHSLSTDFATSPLDSITAELQDANLLITMDEDVVKGKELIQVRVDNVWVASFYNNTAYQSDVVQIQDGKITYKVAKNVSDASEIKVQHRSGIPNNAGTIIDEKILDVKQLVSSDILSNATATLRSNVLFIRLDEEVFNSKQKVKFYVNGSYVGESYNGTAYYSNVVYRNSDTNQVVIRAKTGVQPTDKIVLQHTSGSPGKNGVLLSEKVLELEL